MISLVFLEYDQGYDRHECFWKVPESVQQAVKGIYGFPAWLQRMFLLL